MEANPKKFNLDAMELAKRKAFITSTRQTVKVHKLEWHAPLNQFLYVYMSHVMLDVLFYQQLKDHMTGATAISGSERKNRQVIYYLIVTLSKPVLYCDSSFISGLDFNGGWWVSWPNLAAQW